ncbi:hypothetical protein I8H83_04795 [Candidatus Saccharibacteria bacterium]|nr:hypothetical protein [Candidatus Saccharibacteria bacterium]MBH2007895.1 hypothetical protein [Candidatus Saccharibacteria bacterium]
MQYTRIALDIDDTIADTTEALRRVVNSQLGANLTQDDYRTPGEYWGYYERVWRQHGVADQLSFKQLNQQMAIDQSHVSLIEGAQVAVHRLARDAEVLLVTSRDPSCEGATREWFAHHFGAEDIQLYFCTSHVDEKAKTKGRLCKELGVQLLVDDNASHCQTALDEGVDAILFGRYGWHHGATAPVKQCRTWGELVEVLYG